MKIKPCSILSVIAESGQDSVIGKLIMNFSRYSGYILQMTYVYICILV